MIQNLRSRMHTDSSDRATAARLLRAPFFEIGPKNLLRLSSVIEVGQAAQEAGLRHGVAVILTVPTSFIAPVSAALPDIFVFAQTMDDDPPGPSVGRVTAESLTDAGAAGVMLNHDSHPLDPDALSRAIGRARANELMTMVCAGSEAEVLDLLPLEPTIVLFEPPALIGQPGGTARPWISGIDEQVRIVAPQVLMMHAGGVGSPADAFSIMSSGAAGTGSTSGVLLSESPTSAAAEFIQAARAGFDAYTNGGEG